MNAGRKDDLSKSQGKQKQVLGTDNIITKFMSLSVQVNAQTKYSVFIFMQGHVEWIDFRISESKTNYNNKILAVEHLNLNGDKRFEELVYQLEHILENGELDFDKLQEDRGGYIGADYIL
ncbi:MAG: hypothetical protein NRZ51_23375 [Bacillus paranthracis]|nr:MAG: hypothetical protein NRZ50_05815 [Bacillus paranthracis]WAI34313.1 MAG: hypothetical protein NRZ52_09240 [Bacillus paranthracis]WAI37560.1 MAG: hypothetical protein NRZ51_23375 [Bacillus paranthracis]